MTAPEAVLLLSFGGPGGPEDVRPFLANVLRGRRASPARVDEVAAHYALFGGVSPLTAVTLSQARGLEARLRARGLALPVRVGMRNWHPYVADTLAELSRGGVRRALGLVSAAGRCHSACGQYAEDVAAARRTLRARGLADVEVVLARDWQAHPGYVAVWAAHVAEAVATLPEDVRGCARLVFTAHSIPQEMADRCMYERSFALLAESVSAMMGTTDFALVYQSRSGRPGDPWLGPDVCDYLREERARGLRAAVLCPIGFVCDHLEVLYDLDHQAGDLCRALGLPMARARTPNDAPAFLDALADAAEAAWRWHARHRALPVVG
ncbi:MAG: ferrochelatase [Deltaproteobacteria bacterium]|nr:ferrochelatase [Deltaproteobacteria bacterium]